MESTESGDARAVERLAAALSVLGWDDEFCASAKATQADFDDPGAYRAWLASALLGAAQAEAMTADSMPLGSDARFAIWQRQLSAAGVADDAAAQVELMQWQVQRACAPLPALASEHRTDPIPLAAGQAAEGLRLLLAVVVATRGAVAAGDVPRLAAQAGRLREARKVLLGAIDNTDLLLELLGSVDI